MGPIENGDAEFHAPLTLRGCLGSDSDDESGATRGGLANLTDDGRSHYRASTNPLAIGSESAEGYGGGDLSGIPAGGDNERLKLSESAISEICAI